jgi:BON domain
MPTTRNLSIALLLAACLACGQSTRSATPAKRLAMNSNPSAASQRRLSDSQLESLIRAKFAKSKSANTFTVHVQGGVATIEGKTDVIQHKGAATHMAKTAGAVAVNNRVEISDAARQKAAANLETGRRRAQVKRGDARSEK